MVYTPSYELDGIHTECFESEPWNPSVPPEVGLGYRQTHRLYSCDLKRRRALVWQSCGFQNR